jgi:YegS/Rv2252/BmrU family lipid kinase
VVIVFNPTAGQRRASRLWRVLDVLLASGVRLDVAETQYPGHATELARAAARSGAELVVAAGGDGTIAETANGLLGTDTLLGVIPLGTANVLAQEFALPSVPQAIAAALAFRRTRALWPGLARSGGSTRLFVQMLGVGFDAQVVHKLSLPMKRAMGRAAYVAQSLRELARYPYPPVRLRLDGVYCEAASAIIGKGRFYGGPFLLAPEARPTQPGFQVALFPHGGAAATLFYGAALPLNLLHRAPGLRLVQARAVELIGGAPLPVQADGDPAGHTPLAVTDAPAPLRLVVS